MAHDHHHHHDHTHESSGNIAVAFFMNLAFTIIELVGGMFTNSVAILSDAVHDFGDCLSLGAAWYFQRLSVKKGTARYTYGYKRFSLLGAIVNSVVLVTGSVYVLSESIQRLFSPQETSATGMLILAVVGIIANGIPVLRARKAKSINERVVSLHLLEDVLGWAAVLAGAVVMRLTGLTMIDPILSVASICYVLFNVCRNVKQLLPIILQGVPADVDRAHIIEKLEAIEAVEGVHDIHIWSLDEAYNVLTVHIVLRRAAPMEALAALKCCVRALLREEGVQHATIEFEAPDETCDLGDCTR